jgi:hypothetical protein
MTKFLQSLLVRSDDFRALVYSVVAFRSFLRPSTLVSVWWSSVLRVGDRFLLRLLSRDWKVQGKGKGSVRMPTFDLTEMPHLRVALEWAVEDSSCGNFLGISKVPDGNSMFKRALHIVGSNLANVCTQYSCRRGGASAACALGVSLDVIETVGGWAQGSKAMRDHYIDRSVGCTEATRFFFKTLLPGGAPLFGAPHFH